jgi:hypothetical protein
MEVGVEGEGPAEFTSFPIWERKRKPHLSLVVVGAGFATPSAASRKFSLLNLEKVAHIRGDGQYLK